MPQFKFNPIQVSNPNLGGNFQAGQAIGREFGQNRQDEKINALELQSKGDAARFESVIQGALQLKQISDPQQKISFLKNRKIQLQNAGIPTNDTDEALALAEAGDFEGLERETDFAIQAGQSLNAKPQTPGAGQFRLGNQQFSHEGKLIATGSEPVETVSELDQARIAKLRAETAQIGKNKETPSTTRPLSALIDDASPELQKKAQEAFDLSGGGDKGVKAVERVLKEGVEIERRAAAPETLKANFPNADESEMSELQAVVDSAKTTESGFKAAEKLRVKQRQVKKGKVFQRRAVELLDRILSADELNDVIGSVEGSDESLIPFGGQKIRGDAESEIIADIEEAGNILTADNLDIMSGVLSETDIKIIANLAGGALNRKRGEETFIKDVTKLRDKMQGNLGVDESTASEGFDSVSDNDLLSF